MKYKYILFFIILLTACQQKRTVEPTFYYWKTVYKQNKVETQYLKKFQSKRLYVRIMDVDMEYDMQPIPIAPISFADKLPDSIEAVPVVFIVNEVLSGLKEAQIKQLAAKITKFVKAKLEQGGKNNFNELQIDCDWTETTKNNYFLLLNEITGLNEGKIISVTLRLHQLKNQTKSGIPPVDKVLLMCYNMGNLRKFGKQNSVIDVTELKKYANENLSKYPLKIDIALPIFSWAVIFNPFGSYLGISKRLSSNDLKNTNSFARQPDGLYLIKKDLPKLGLKRDCYVRFEDSNSKDVKATATYLAKYLSKEPLNLIFYHLDEQLINNYKVNELEEIAHILR